MSNTSNGNPGRPMSVEDWPTEPERKYADYQAQLADDYDLGVGSRVIETDAAGRIHYLVAGDPDGDPMLVLHGATGQAAYWLPMVSGLTDHYRLYIPDMPGEGLSAKPSFRGRDHRTFLVAYLVEFLDALGLARTDVIAHSFGGAQAFLLAIDHDRVDRLCLVGAPVGLSKEFPVLIRLMSLRGLNRLLLWMMNRGDPVRNAEDWIGLFVEDNSAIPDAYYDLYAIRTEIPGLQESLLSLMTELSSFGRVRPILEFREEVVAIDRPTSFIWGLEDYYWAPSLGQSVANQMSHAEFHELEDHGHTPWLEPGDRAASLVQSFLDFDSR